MKTVEAVRISLVRHGESVSNQSQIWQGQGDSPLSVRGRAQAASLAARLALQPASPGVPRVISSDLSRAVDTAHALGLGSEQRQELREFDVGRWEGLTRSEVEQRYPEEIARLKAGEDVALGGGETYREFAERIDVAFARVRSDAQPGEHVMVVCHGGVIGAILSGLCGFRATRRFPLARMSNTSLSELGFFADRTEFRVFNDTAHLAHEAGWPEFADAQGLVALTCGPGDALDGTIAAQYAMDTDISLPAPEPMLATRVASLQEQHPEQRVALRAERAVGWSYVAQTLWPEGPPDGLALDDRQPLRGHVGLVHGRLTVLDFGHFSL